MHQQTKFFDLFKSFLNKTVQTLLSGLISWTATRTQKLGRVAEAEKLKSAGNNDQFLFNSTKVKLVGLRSEYQAEELVSGSEDEKRIRKAQERALKKKTHNAPKRSIKGRSASFRVSWWRIFYAAFDNRQFFRGISLPFLCISACYASVHTLPALTLL